MIDYVRVIRPYPGGMDWIDAKRILPVMNMDGTHFVTLEILLHEGRMNVYDCQLMLTEHAKFLTYIQLVFELLPKLLKQSGIMEHFLEKFLNEPWEFTGRMDPMVKNESGICPSLIFFVLDLNHLIILGDNLCSSAIT